MFSNSPDQQCKDTLLMNINEANDSTEARYANSFRVGYNAYEILIEFGQAYEDESNTRMHTRIVTSPNYAKELLKTLMASINSYEAQFGTISDDKE